MADGGAGPGVTAPPDACARCGEPHEIIACPFVKAIEFEDGDGRLIRRIEFLTPADYGPPAWHQQPEPASEAAAYPKLGDKRK